MTLFYGSAPALITPMNEDFTVDFDSYRALVKKCINAGVPALVVNGTTGEASTLTVEEEHTLIKIAMEEANGKCKVIAGTGSNDTMYAIEQSKIVEELGVDGLLVVTPYYNKTSKNGLLNHYKMLADSVNIPVILYNVPGRTGMTIPVDVVEELAKHPKIVAIKDATGDMSYTMEVLTKTKNLDFVVYSGNDDIILPVMASGGAGVISVLSNVYPRETELLCKYILEGNMQEAMSLAYALDDVNDQLFSDVNPINVKAALEKQGMCKEVLRLPLVPTTQENKGKLFKAMDNFEKLGY